MPRSPACPAKVSSPGPRRLDHAVHARPREGGGLLVDERRARRWASSAPTFPKELAWVLDPTDIHFGMSRAILPMNLTGVYGYGQLSMGSTWPSSAAASTSSSAPAPSWPRDPGALVPFPGTTWLPYVVGACAIYVHGEILGGLVSASAGQPSLRGPPPSPSPPSKDLRPAGMRGVGAMRIGVGHWRGLPASTRRREAVGIHLVGEHHGKRRSGSGRHLRRHRA